MGNRVYSKPMICQVELRPEEAVLGGCKLQGTDVGTAFQVQGRACWVSQLYPGSYVYILCQSAGS